MQPESTLQKHRHPLRVALWNASPLSSALLRGQGLLCIFRLYFKASFICKIHFAYFKILYVKYMIFSKQLFFLSLENRKTLFYGFKAQP